MSLTSRLTHPQQDAHITSRHTFTFSHSLSSALARAAAQTHTHTLRTCTCTSSCVHSMSIEHRAFTAHFTSLCLEHRTARNSVASPPCLRSRALVAYTAMRSRTHLRIGAREGDLVSISRCLPVDLASISRPPRPRQSHVVSQRPGRNPPVAGPPQAPPFRHALEVITPRQSRGPHEALEVIAKPSRRSHHRSSRDGGPRSGVA